MRSRPVLIMGAGAVAAVAAVAGIVAAGIAGIAEAEEAACYMSRRLADTMQSCMQKALVAHVHRRRHCLVALHYLLQRQLREVLLLLPHPFAILKKPLLCIQLQPTREV